MASRSTSLPKEEWNSPDLDAYFARLGYDGPVVPQLRTLQRLHAARREDPVREPLAFRGRAGAPGSRIAADKLLRRGAAAGVSSRTCCSRTCSRRSASRSRAPRRVRRTCRRTHDAAKPHVASRAAARGDYIGRRIRRAHVELAAKLVAGIEQATLPAQPVGRGGWWLSPRSPRRRRMARALHLRSRAPAGCRLRGEQLVPVQPPESMFLKMAVAALRRHHASSRCAAFDTSEHYPDGRGDRGEIRSVAQWRKWWRVPSGFESRMRRISTRNWRR